MTRHEEVVMIVAGIASGFATRNMGSGGIESVCETISRDSKAIVDTARILVAELYDNHGLPKT